MGFSLAVDSVFGPEYQVEFPKLAASAPDRAAAAAAGALQDRTLDRAVVRRDAVAGALELRAQHLAAGQHDDLELDFGIAAAGWAARRCSA